MEPGEEDSYVPDIFEKALVAKWFTDCYPDIIQDNPKSEEEVKNIPRCNLCKWQQAWILEHRSKGLIICSCLNEGGEDTYEFDHSEKALVEKWLPSTNDNINVIPSE